MSGDYLARDQRTRRANEIRSAALAYVRECGRQRQVLDIEEFGQRRWPRDRDEKRRIMCDAVDSGVPVVYVWQRYEVSGFIARALVGAASYGDLYRILRDNGMSAGFRPAEVAKWAAEGKIPKTEVGEIFGIANSEIEAFIAAWLAGETSYPCWEWLAEAALPSSFPRQNQASRLRSVGLQFLWRCQHFFVLTLC